MHSSTDEFQHAISATEEPHANSGFSNQISSPTANNINYVKISLLNAEQFTVPTYDNATVKDAIIALRNQLGLRADAQYSLFLKDISRGRPMFTVLPDVMSIEEAEGLARKFLIFNFYFVRNCTSKQRTMQFASQLPKISPLCINEEHSTKKAMKVCRLLLIRHPSGLWI